MAGPFLQMDAVQSRPEMTIIKPGRSLTLSLDSVTVTQHVTAKCACRDQARITCGVLSPGRVIISVSESF